MCGASFLPPLPLLSICAYAQVGEGRGEGLSPIPLHIRMIFFVILHLFHVQSLVP